MRVRVTAGVRVKVKVRVRVKVTMVGLELVTTEGLDLLLVLVPRSYNSPSNPFPFIIASSFGLLCICKTLKE
jgi:hypothetical protein